MLHLATRRISRIQAQVLHVLQDGTSVPHKQVTFNADVRVVTHLKFMLQREQPMLQREQPKLQSVQPVFAPQASSARI